MTNPVLMTVSRQEDIIVDMVVVEVLEGPIPVGDVALGSSVRHLQEN